jgi:hypothetical protein
MSAYIKKDGKWEKFNRNWTFGNNSEAMGMLKKATGGEFAFYNHEAGFCVLVTYNPTMFAFPRLWWVPERPQINLELFTPGVTLKPGQSLRFAYGFKYLKLPPETNKLDTTPQSVARLRACMESPCMADEALPEPERIPQRPYG